MPICLVIRTPGLDAAAALPCRGAVHAMLSTALCLRFLKTASVVSKHAVLAASQTNVWRAGESLDPQARKCKLYERAKYVNGFQLLICGLQQTTQCFCVQHAKTLSSGCQEATLLDMMSPNQLRYLQSLRCDLATSWRVEWLPQPCTCFIAPTSHTPCRFS